MLQISQRGWRTEEPSYSDSVEKPRALRKLSEVAFGGEDSWEKLAKQFNLSSLFVKEILTACEPLAAPVARKLDLETNVLRFASR